ncbi:MAG: hypothetical protein HPY45_10045 [Anaerolineae bacterium]|nr:hypothetical protein [Anaerolineae bacterium]
MQHQSEQEISRLMEQADAQESLQDYKTAYDLYRQMLEIDPQHAIARLGKGRCAARMDVDIPSRLQEACEEILNASQLLPSEHHQKTHTAWALTEAVSNHIKRLENEYQNQLFSKLSSSSPSHFSSSLFGGALKQNKLDMINQEQNKHFQSLVPAFVRTLQMAWSLSNDPKTASHIAAILDQIKNCPVLLQDSIHLFSKEIEPLLVSIRATYPDKASKQPAAPKAAIGWLLVILIVVIIVLVWLVHLYQP